jgi:thiol-disulfide isomerase/thioredoxin
MFIFFVTSACATHDLQHAAGPEKPQPANFSIPPIDSNAQLGWITTDNKRVRLADYGGQVLVLDFYATWCVPCRESIPGLIALQRRFNSNGLQVVGLNVGGADDRVKVADFQRELGIEYPLGFPDRSLTDLFLSDDQTIPQTFVFGRNGQLLKRFIGYQSSTRIAIDQLVERELTSH